MAMAGETDPRSATREEHPPAKVTGDHAPDPGVSGRPSPRASTDRRKLPPRGVPRSCGPPEWRHTPGLPRPAGHAAPHRAGLARLVFREDGPRAAEPPATVG